ASGCRKPPRSHTTEKGQNEAKGDPWEGAAKRLKKETEPLSCKAALSELNRELATHDDVPKPTPLTPEALDALAAVVPLNPADREEIHGSAFSSHDPVYLCDCLYLRDAARTISLPGLKPEQLADLGFAWVCRQVYLNPWL